MSCQKIINVLAVASFALSGAIASSGVYVYVNRDSIIDGIKSQVMGGLGGGALGGGALTGDVGLPIDTQPQASAPVPQSSPPSAPIQL
jgi:hypothetical protein